MKDIEGKRRCYIHTSSSTNS